MLLTVDLDLEAVVSWPSRCPVEVVRIPRRPLGILPVQFVRGGIVVAIGTGAETGRFIAKREHDASAAAFLLEARAWTIVGSPTPQYVFPFLSNTPAVRALLGVGTVCPFARATLEGQIDWVDQAGNAGSTRPFTVELWNEVPTGAEVDSTTPLVNMLNWSNLTRLAGGLVTDLDAQPTLGVVRYDTLISMVNVLDPATDQPVNAGALTVWQFQNRADATGPGLQRPLDFDPATNPGVWTKVS